MGGTRRSGRYSARSPAEGAKQLATENADSLADVDYSGAVDTADAGILAAHWGLSDMSFADGDLNGDARVNAADAAILAANWGASFTPVEGRSTKDEVRRKKEEGRRQKDEGRIAVGQAVPDVDPLLLASDVRQSLTYEIRHTSVRQSLTYEIRRTSVRHSLTYVLPCPSASSVVNEKAADAALAEQYGPPIDSPLAGQRGLPWSRTLARRNNLQ